MSKAQAQRRIGPTYVRVSDPGIKCGLRNRVVPQPDDVGATAKMSGNPNTPEFREQLLRPANYSEEQADTWAEIEETVRHEALHVARAAAGRDAFLR